MKRITLVDTGPLVAAFDRSDQHHAAAVQRLKEIPLPLVTCEPVVAETCFLLSKYPGVLHRLGNWLNLGKVQIPFRMIDDSKRVFSLMKKYENLPMSLADACLVVMAEKSPQGRIFTFDRHFRFYRTPSRRVVKTIGLEP